METKVVLIPHDGTREASAALVYARRLSDVLGATVVILHVSPAPIASESLQRKLGLSAEEIKGCILESTVAKTAAEGIIRRAEQLRAKLIVISSRADETKIGSVTAEVVKGARCPVLAARSGLAPERLSARSPAWRILVPHDASPATTEAVAWAAKLACGKNAHLDILHIVAAGEPAPAEPGSLPIGPYDDHQYYDLLSWTEEFLERLCVPECMPRGLRPKIHLAHGEPAAEIIRFAETHASDLIVVAWRGSLEEGRARVVRKLLARAPCPLLFIVPGALPGREQPSARNAPA
ncbi:MAG TPA: universal stress protein [Blastocatellia bacterium]